MSKADQIKVFQVNAAIDGATELQNEGRFAEADRLLDWAHAQLAQIEAV